MTGLTFPMLSPQRVRLQLAGRAIDQPLALNVFNSVVTVPFMNNVHKLDVSFTSATWPPLISMTASNLNFSVYPARGFNSIILKISRSRSRSRVCGAQIKQIKQKTPWQRTKATRTGGAIRGLAG